jgi:hypothetical protein
MDPEGEIVRRRFISIRAGLAVTAAVSVALAAVISASPTPAREGAVPANTPGVSAQGSAPARPSARPVLLFFYRPASSSPQYVGVRVTGRQVVGYRGSFSPESESCFVGTVRGRKLQGKAGFHADLPGDDSWRYFPLRIDASGSGPRFRIRATYFGTPPNLERRTGWRRVTLADLRNLEGGFLGTRDRGSWNSILDMCSSL